MECAFVHLDAGRRVLTTLHPPPPLPGAPPVPPGVVSIWQPDGPVDSVSWVMSPVCSGPSTASEKKSEFSARKDRSRGAKWTCQQQTNAKGDMKAQ